MVPESDRALFKSCQLDERVWSPVGHPRAGRVVDWMTGLHRMITRLFISLLIFVAVGPAAMPWRLVCHVDCRERCCQTPAEGSGAAACCGGAASVAAGSAGSACARSCCSGAEPSAADGRDGCCGSACGGGCGGVGDAGADRADVPCCCLFIPISPCEGCELLRLCMWAPWQSPGTEDVLRGLDSLGLAMAECVALPRPAHAVPTTAPLRPPWSPRVGEFLSRICVLTI
jgi:hypothetical protein